MSNYLTVKQAAELLVVSSTTVYDFCREGRLPHVRIGCGRGTIRIARTALDHFVRQSQGAASAVGELSTGEKDYFASLRLPSTNSPSRTRSQTSHK